MELLRQLKEKGVQFERGLSSDEIHKIEGIYSICFPKELKNFYMTCLPISNGFYKWRDFSEENVNHIKDVMSAPYKNVFQDTDDIEWCEAWGKEPVSAKERDKIIKQKVNMAPKLIPIYAHRYIVSTEKEDSPVFSIHGTDIVCYGENLQKYFEIEFLGKSYHEADFRKSLETPFWGEIL